MTKPILTSCEITEVTQEEDGGLTRRKALSCAGWAGAGILWTIVAGVPRARILGSAEAAEAVTPADFSFVQISDSHVGFNKEANPDVVGTLHEAIDQIGRVKGTAKLMIHTGDVSHLSKDEQFDTANEVIKGAGLDLHVVPGEHDLLVDDGKGFYERFEKGAKAGGWYSFDSQGVHFIGLNNVFNLHAGGLGNLGDEQLEWLEDDLKGRSASQPIVVFAHIPLWQVYPDWGWGTEDGAKALGYLKRFGSVTVLNGHIHQTLQKVEGNVAFHTAMSTAFPQPAPGAPAGPGPMKVAPGVLKTVLGVASVSFVQGTKSLAVVDHPLGA